MTKWLLKGAIHRVLAALPFGHYVNELLQVHVTRSLDLTQQRFENKLSDCARHLRHYAQHSHETTLPRVAVELGSGWYPVTPLGLAVHGVPEVITCDIAPLVRPARVRMAMQRIVQYYREGKLKRWWPEADGNRIETLSALAADKSLRTTSDLLAPLGIKLLVGDARELPFRSGSVDLITSYGVLMHIKKPVLKQVLKEFHRVLKPQGVMSHWIDLTDLYHWCDSSLSPLNFLRYSDSTWKWLDNPMTPANRLRVSDYRSLFDTCRFAVVEERNRQGDASLLAQLPLAKEFESYDSQDLLVLDTWLAAVASGTSHSHREAEEAVSHV